MYYYPGCGNMSDKYYENLDTLLYAHAYEPWYKDRADGKKEIQKCLNDCIEYIKGENK